MEDKKHCGELGKIIDSLHRNISSLRDFVETLDGLLASHERATLTAKVDPRQIIPMLYIAYKLHPEDWPELEKHKPKLDKIFSSRIDVKESKDEDGKDCAEIQFKQDEFKEFSTLIDKLNQNAASRKHLYKSTLISLLSAVELFFAELMHFYFRRFPEALSSKDKVFSLDDLKLFSTIDDARSHLVESRVESVLRDSFDEWISFFRNKIGLSMSYVDSKLNVLIETFQRRNLVVHNGGIVNSIYLSKVDKALTSNLKKGQNISVTLDYLRSAFDIFEFNCLLIAFELWKKYDQSSEARGEKCAEIIYKHLLKNNWNVACGTSYFLAGDKLSSETHQLIGKLNFWLCSKRLGEWDKVKPEVEKADMAAKSPRFKLAWLSLLEKSNDFFALLPSALRSKEIYREELLEFPILEEMRKDKRFKKYLPQKKDGVNSTKKISPKKNLKK